MGPGPYPSLLCPLAWLAGRNLGAPSPAAAKSPQAVGSRGYTLCVNHFCVGTHARPSIWPPRTVSQAPGRAAARNSKYIHGPGGHALTSQSSGFLHPWRRARNSTGITGGLPAQLEQGLPPAASSTCAIILQGSATCIPSQQPAAPHPQGSQQHQNPVLPYSGETHIPINVFTE